VSFSWSFSLFLRLLAKKLFRSSSLKMPLFPYPLQIGFLGPYRSFSGGILLSAISTITFGFAYFLPSGIPFFVGILAVRSFQALGSAAFTAGSWAIVGRLFPDRISTITARNICSIITN
jgi:MFS family permease